MNQDRSLVVSDQRMIDKASADLNVPVSAFIVIPGKDGTRKVYITYIGMMWLLLHDGRITMEVKTECVTDPYENPSGVAHYIATVKFKDGSTYVGHGWSCAKDESKPRWQAAQIAETRAKRRVAITATAGQLVSAGIQPEEEE